jgi:uncharacterized protein (DUF488 family)
MSVTVWTIGHSNMALEALAGRLHAHGISRLADVRRYPGSRRHPQFNREALAASLARERITYVHLPELGGRRAPRPDSRNTAWRHPAFRGYADYMDTAEFRDGVKRLLTEASSGRVAIMCAEALWWQCHRALIADALKAAGHHVLHITAAGVQEHPYSSAARIVDGRLSYAAPSLLDDA